MDKINELTKIQKYEEKILIAKVLNKIKFVQTRNRVANTDFLDLSQKSIIEEMMQKRKFDNFLFYGGYGQAERTMMIIFPEGKKQENQQICTEYTMDINEKINNILDDKILNQIMSIIRITLPKELRGMYEHRNYLGALMKLGLKREKIGDINVREDGADIIISKDIENFLTSNLPTLIRFKKSKIENMNIKDLKYVEQLKEKIKINVPSMRLDAIVGELAKCSRKEASELIETERVFVNFKEELRGTKIIEENTTITIRGKGRFQITNILGTTKSGRISVEVLI